MAITSRHINIYKFIKRIEKPTLKNLSICFNIKPGNLINYLREIYEILEEKKVSGEEMLETIKKGKNILHLLKEKQSFLKKERMEYIIFYILSKKNIVISDLEKKLNISRRALNYDLEIIKNMFQEKKLILESNNKGVFLKGEEFLRKRELHIYLFKYFVEKNFLPKESKKLYLEYISRIKDFKIRKQMKKLNRIISEKGTHYSYISLLGFYIIEILEEKDELKIKDIKNNKEFFSILELNNSEKNMENIYLEFKNSFLKELPVKSLKLFSILVKDAFCVDKKYSLKIIDKVKLLLKILEEEYQIVVENKEEFHEKICPWVAYYEAKEEYGIRDCNFINISNIEFTDKMLEVFQRVRDFFPSFTIYDFIIVYFKTKELHGKKKEKKEIVFIYKNIPKVILDTLLENIESKYSIKCQRIVYLDDIEEDLEKNKIDLLITMENIKLDKIQTLRLPIPQF